MQIKEFAERTGVSIRTLHYYDSIGLLRPASVDALTGYRYYDEASLLRMQEIMFFRELDFSLQSIREILSSPDYDRVKAMEEQRMLLTLKKERLERLIEALDNAARGEEVMAAFDKKEFENYKEEARARWGQTDAYREYEEKAKDRSSGAESGIAEGLNAIFGDFAACKASGAAANSAEARALAEKLQRYITENYYTCSGEILRGLGQMYVMDERFRENIDRNGAGTAAYVRDAIEACVR